jgi:hypothetical protein
MIHKIWFTTVRRSPRSQSAFRGSGNKSVIGAHYSSVKNSIPECNSFRIRNRSPLSFNTHARPVCSQSLATKFPEEPIFLRLHWAGFLYRVMILREGRCFPPRPRETNSGRRALSSTEATYAQGPDSTAGGVPRDTGTVTASILKLHRLGSDFRQSHSQHTISHQPRMSWEKINTL